MQGPIGLLRRADNGFTNETSALPNAAHQVTTACVTSHPNTKQNCRNLSLNLENFPDPALPNLDGVTSEQILVFPILNGIGLPPKYLYDPRLWTGRCATKSAETLLGNMAWFRCHCYVLSSLSLPSRRYHFYGGISGLYLQKVLIYNGICQCI